MTRTTLVARYAAFAVIAVLANLAVQRLVLATGVETAGRFTAADILASNGVIHVIDKVLLP